MFGAAGSETLQNIEITTCARRADTRQQRYVPKFSAPNRKKIHYLFSYILPCANYWRRKQALGLRTQLVVGQVPGQGAACRNQASVGPRVFRRSPQDPGPAATSLTSSPLHPLLGLSSLPCVENASTFFSRQYVEAASWKRETCGNLS